MSVTCIKLGGGGGGQSGCANISPWALSIQRLSFVWSLHALLFAIAFLFWAN